MNAASPAVAGDTLSRQRDQPASQKQQAQITEFAKRVEEMEKQNKKT